MIWVEVAVIVLVIVDSVAVVVVVVVVVNSCAKRQVVTIKTNLLLKHIHKYAETLQLLTSNLHYTQTHIVNKSF